MEPRLPAGTLETDDTPTPSTGTEDPAGDYRIVFRCPRAADGGQAQGEVACPFHILDEHDAMGQPVLMIDPADPNLAAFNALHGGGGVHPVPGEGPPSERSRDNGVHQPHTTFRTTNGGTGWEDMPYYAPDGLSQDGREIFGEDNAAVMDAQGRVHLASLYAYRDQGTALEPSSGVQYAVSLWSAGRMVRPIDYSVDNVIIRSGSEGTNVVDSIHMAHVPDSDRVMVLWRETPRDGGPGTVRIHWAVPGDSRWQEVEAADGIGPCTGISNPLAIADRIYLACNQQGQANTTTHVYAVDGVNWTIQALGDTPVHGGELTLVQRSQEGHMALLATRLTDGGPVLNATYAFQGANWSAPADLAPDLIDQGASQEPQEIRVTAAAYREDSGTLHLIYMERNPAGSASADGPNPAYVKFFAVYRGTELLDAVDLEMGQLSRIPTGANPSDGDVGAFNDLHDGIVVWQDPQTGEEREFVAFGDHGYVRFGQGIERNAPPPIALVTNPVAPVPIASAGATPALYGVAAGLLSLAMVARMLYSRTETPAEVEAKEP